MTGTAAPPSAAPPPAADTRADNVPAGVACVVGSVFLFSGINAAVKWLTDFYPVSEILFFRNLFGLIPCAILVAGTGGLRSLRTRRWDMHLVRGLLGVTSLGLLFWSFALMPLADAQALSFASPLFLTILAVPILGERVGAWRWGAVLAGLAGVLITVSPGGDITALGAAVGIGSALMFALAMVTIRRMTLTETSAAIAFYYTLVCALASGPFAALDWVRPTALHVAVLAAAGLAGGVGQYFMTRAFAVAPASATAPFNYTSIVWAAAAGYLVWGEVPSPSLLLGLVLVIGGGLVILWRESRRPSALEPATRALEDPVGPSSGRA